jgi:UDP-N-acetylmuramoyl-L-alanyl-D-glutamate--2,6-diaminopimelate ligase
MKKLVKRLVPTSVFKKIEPYGHLAEAILYQSKASFPGRSLKVIGVTGTDGKTTTCTLITQMLRNSGKKVGMITTISIDYGDGRGPQDNPSRLTALGANRLAGALKKMREQKVEWLVLEVTSHGMAQHRTFGVPYDFAVMTNVGHEHLDYHGTFENYRDAKRRLFKAANRNKSGKRVGIINAEDPSARLFAGDVKHPITYGTKQADIKAEDIKLTPAGSSYRVKINNALFPQLDSSDFKIVCHLPGSFNVYNTLAAVTAGLVAGLSKKEITDGIASLHEVEGRMTRVDCGQDFAVIVDYAHTPESFKKILSEVRPLTSKKLICVFGSAGRRDEAKRAAQGAIAGRFCDTVIISEEDDRDVDGEEIMQQILSGATKAGKVLGKDVFLVHDREDAIQKAVDIAKPGDIVLLLGKGHEKSILSNGPQAAELRHLPQNDEDTRRVVKRKYDEVTAAKLAIARKLG